jgi:hypothetical protein
VDIASGLLNSSRSFPPCRKAKDYDTINLYDDITPGYVSFDHPLKADLGEYGAFPICECVIGAFDETEAIRHGSSVRVAARHRGRVGRHPRPCKTTVDGTILPVITFSRGHNPSGGPANMERIIESFTAVSDNGIVHTVIEWQTIIRFHLRGGAQEMKGATRLALTDGSPVVRFNGDTFRIVKTGEFIRTRS